MGSAPGPMQIRDALAQAQPCGVARLDAQWLLQHLLGQPRAWLLAHDDQRLTAAQAASWQHQLQRRAAGVPLAYVLGEQEFCGLTLQVSPAVLIPRPETELLVDWALECLHKAAAQQTRPLDVLDLGTGSGAIALAVKHRFSSAQVCATDLSPAALTAAQNNATRLGLAVEFTSGAWWAAVPQRGFDLVLANPPYIAAGDLHLQALQHEPLLALSPGGDGLADLQTIVRGAPDHLRPGGWLLLEHGHDQAATVQQLLAKTGAFSAIQTRVDLAGMARCTGARWAIAT